MGEIVTMPKSNRVLASQVAAELWRLLIDTAGELDAGGSIEFIARDSGWSETSIKKRVNAAAYFLNRGTMAEVLVEWGPEKTVSEWQKECNQNQAKGPGETVLWSKRVPHELKAALDEMLKTIHGVTGASNEDILRFLAELFRDSDPAEIQFLWNRQMGERE